MSVMSVRYRADADVLGGRCGKPRFTKSEAAGHLKQALADPKRREQRVYFCWQCQVWHLTSQTLTEPKEVAL